MHPGSEIVWIGDGQEFLLHQRLKSLCHPVSGSIKRSSRRRRGMERGGGEKVIFLTRLALQKTRMSKAQKKTAMTPVPMRITISTLALSLEPPHKERRQLTTA